MTRDDIIRAESQLENQHATLPVVVAAIAAFNALSDMNDIRVRNVRRMLFRSIAPFDGLHDALFSLAEQPGRLTGGQQLMLDEAAKHHAKLETPKPDIRIRTERFWHRADCATCAWLGQWWDDHEAAKQQGAQHSCSFYWNLPITFTTPDGESITMPARDIDAWATERDKLSNHGSARAARDALTAAYGA